MSEDDGGPLDIISAPSLPGGFDIASPVASSPVALAVIISQLLGIAILFAVDFGFIGLNTVLFLPLGLLAFGFIVSPLTTLSGVREALSVLMLGLHTIMFIYIVHPEHARDALLIFSVVLIGILVLELPRRFSLKE